MRRMTVALAASGLVLTACTVGITSGTTTTSTTRPIESREPTEERTFAGAALQPFESCSDFLDYVKQHAVEQVGPYGLGGFGGYHGQDSVITEVEASMSEGDASRRIGLVRGVDYSGMHVQGEGVDDADSIKTDGERIFFVARGRLFWIDVSGTPEIVASIPFRGVGGQQFLSGHRLLVMSSSPDYIVSSSVDTGVVTGVVPRHSPRVLLTEVDVSDPASMEVVGTLRLNGTLLSSRMKDESIRVVIRSEPTGFDWVYPEGSGVRAEQKAIEANKRLIEDSTLKNWVPWYVLKDHRGWTTGDGPVLRCDQIGRPDEFSGLSMVTILSIDLDEGREPGNSIGFLAEGQTAYASVENVYVSTAPWMVRPVARFQQDDNRDSLWTQIHMFDASDPDTVRYVASGEVEGVLHSHRAMDQFDGTLRVVVTDENSGWDSADAPDTAVVAMQRVGDDLVEVGSVDGLGKNARVRAVRFAQEKAYVVTSRQVDPLYVLDLSDPTDPQLKGELKIDGHYPYLHPIGEDLLLVVVGEGAIVEGRPHGPHVSVFDVSDPADPKLVSEFTFDDARSGAEREHPWAHQWQHHAFFWWAPEGIAVLPHFRWTWDERIGEENHFSGAVVLAANPQGVIQIGQIRHPDVNEPGCDDCFMRMAPINRSLVIGGTLLTFSDIGVLASDLGSLDDVAWLPFAGYR